MANTIKRAGMKLEQQTADDLLVVEGYGNMGFKLMERRFEGGVLVLPFGVFPLDVQHVSELSLAKLAKLVEVCSDAAQAPELLLVGTGETMQLLPPAFKRELQELGLGFDIMDTGAAARTYNVLLMEGRRVAVALVPVP